MNTFLRTLSLAWLSVPMFAADATAAATSRWQVDPAASTVTFHGSSTLHDFDGKAMVTAGVIDLTPGRESGSATVSSASMNTDESSRDRTMHDDHMESAKYPDIVFTLTRLERAPSGAIAHGTWAMHGATVPVDLPVVLPTLPSPAGIVPHLTSTFTLDMRTWNIAVPSAMLVIHVKPTIRVDVDLALKPATAVAIKAGPALADITLADQRGVSHDLGAESRGRLLILFPIDERITAKRCDDLLRRRLDPAMPLIRVIDGAGITGADHDVLVKRLNAAVTDPDLAFLLDWNGAVRARLAAPSAPVLFIGFTADGGLSGELEGHPDAQVLTSVLALIGRAAEPPFTADEIAGSGKGRK
jgi:polyisoprenoid-binding protein YceI